MVDILYGRNPILESLRAGRRQARQLLLAEGSEEQGVLQEILHLGRQRRIPLQRLPKQELARRVGHHHHQGLLLEASDYPYSDIPRIMAAAESAGEPPFLLILDLLQDPQNAGSLLRTAEAVGVHGVILQKRRGVGITPAVVNASSGAAEHLLVAQETNLVRTMRELQQLGLWLYGLEDREEATDYHQARLDGAIALVVGHEGSGLRRLTRETCDALIRLPMRGRIESLNASVAGSVALFAIWQARDFSPGEKDP